MGDLFMDKTSCELKLIRKKESHKMRVWWQDQLLLSYLQFRVHQLKMQKEILI